MRKAKYELPVKIDVPGAVARQADRFGDPCGFGARGGEFFSLGVEHTTVMDLMLAQTGSG